MKINSAYICVKNMERAIDFYEKLFNKPFSKRDKIFSCIEIGSFRLFLFNNQKVNEDVTYGDNCLLSIEVNEMSSFIEKLNKLNAPIVFPLTIIENKQVLEFKDPEGNDMEVFSEI